MAGLDPAGYDLGELHGNNPVPKRYEDDHKIRVKNGDRFYLLSETGELAVARMSPAGYEEVSRAKVLEPTGPAFGRKVAWAPPAFANRCVFVRDEREILCASLARP